jgi:neutral trehalase
MIKIIPLLFIPLFFLIVYLGVENLTQKNFENEINDASEEENFIVNKNDNSSSIQISSENKHKEQKKIEDEKTNFGSKKSIVDKDSKIKEKVQQSGTVKKESKLKEIKQKKNQEVDNFSKVLIQFGAFSRKDYAENSKIEIEKKIKEKFKEVTLDIDFIEDKKLYKLVYLAENIKLAKSICKFSKNIKINCLIKSK